MYGAVAEFFVICQNVVVNLWFDVYHYKGPTYLIV
jgi:hypothetical protein